MTQWPVHASLRHVRLAGRVQNRRSDLSFRQPRADRPTTPAATLGLSGHPPCDRRAGGRAWPPEASVASALPSGWLIAGRHGRVRLIRDGSRARHQTIASRDRDSPRRCGDPRHGRLGVAVPALDQHDVHPRPTPSACERLGFGDGQRPWHPHRPDQSRRRGLRRAEPEGPTENRRSSTRAMRSLPRLASVGRTLVAYTTYHPAPLGDDAEDPVHAIALSLDHGEQWHEVRAPTSEHVVLSLTRSVWLSRASRLFPRA